jgi:hypothetical protein
MAPLANAELKRVVAAMKSRKFATLGGESDFELPRQSGARSAAAKMVESVAAKAGLDLSKLNKLLADDQKASRRAFDKQRAAAARDSRAAQAAFRSGTASRLQALTLLRTPFLPSLVNLDKPFLIWQLPNPQLAIFIDSQIASMNSSVDVLVNIIDGSNSTRFVFFFLWQNASDFTAVANVASSLIVNGACSVQARPGILSGHRATLGIAASLRLMRWSGWGTDPVTGESIDQTLNPNVQQTQRRQVTFLDAQGGHIFEGAAFASKSFSFEPFPLSHSLFVIPGKAVVIFEVTLEFSYGFDGGGDIQDSVFADFSSNGNGVFCPNVELEVLNPLPLSVGGATADG